MKFLANALDHWKITLASIAVLLALIIGAVWLFSTPKPKSNKPADIAKFVASSQFNRLTDKQKETYMRQMRGNRNNRGDMRKTMQSMSEAERRAMFQNMHALREKRMLKELSTYMKMSQEEKNAFLDAKIAEQDKRMADFAKRRAEREAQRKKDGQNNQQNQRNGQNNQQRRRPTEAQRASFMKNRIETTSPEVRAARQKMMQDMMKRRQQTGKAMQRPPRPPRG